LQKSHSSLDVGTRIFETIERLRSSNANFQEAYETYVSQYGKEKLRLSKPLNLAGTVNPVALVVGRNCIIFYNDESRTLKGSRGSVQLVEGDVCIIGRREPQDSTLTAWKSDVLQTELEEYNPRVGTIPSRVHCALAFLGESEMVFSDLGSSSGTVVIADRPRSVPVVRVYDPGSETSPAIRFERVFTS
jgi:hypothetical protein